MGELVLNEAKEWNKQVAIKRFMISLSSRISETLNYRVKMRKHHKYRR